MAKIHFDAATKEIPAEVLVRLLLKKIHKDMHLPMI